MNNHNDSALSAKPIRCAIYTRKSTDEGLEKEFNTLDAQREACEAFICSQRHEYWSVMAERFDDGGFTGGSMDRPALKRLLTAIDAGEVEVVVVYKVDRLSRSLLDFGLMMQHFESKGISFVSITQQLNTASSMGRLMLNVLLSFAQFEREIISERTRDKMAATRRKGKWAGGRPVPGYRIDPALRKLVVVPEEAERVRTIFTLYLELGSLLPLVQELDQRGWRTRSGKPLTRTALHHLLTNVTCIGKVEYRDEVFAGEQEAIIDDSTWQKVQAMLARNGRGSRQPGRASETLLGGLLRCAACDSAMTPTHTSKRNRKYRYYVCSTAQKLGRDRCPTKSVPAGPMEAVVLQQVSELCRRPEMLDAVLDQAGAMRKRNSPAWDRERARATLAEFAPVWDALTGAEQRRVLNLLLESVTYDAARGTATLKLRADGLESLADELPSEMRL